MTTTQPKRADAGSRASYLAEVSSLLWPPPARTEIARTGRSSRHPGSEQYFIVPHARYPRMLVPADGRFAAIAVSGFNPARSRRSAVLSGALRTALRAGAGGLVLRDRLTVDGGTDSLRAHLSDVLGRDVLVSLLLGAARANRKPVAQLIDRSSGEIIGYAKIGASDLTRRLVAAEAAALETLSRAVTTAVTIPAVWYAGRWRGASILVLRPLPTGGRPPWRSAAAQLRDAMTEIAGIAGVSRGRLADSVYWQGLQAGFDALGSRGTQFRQVLDRIGKRCAGAELAFGAWHGDWSRSNVTVRRSDVLAWDWERFTVGVPLGFDALHYYLQQVRSGRRSTPESAVRQTVGAASQLVGVFARTGRTGADLPVPGTLTAVLFLSDLALRYLRDRQDLAGAELGNPGEWLLPGLTAAVEALS